MQKCPNCGVELKKNKYGELICVNCGMIETKKCSDEKEVNYIG